MKTLDEYSKSQSEILVGFFTTDLQSFQVPKVWTKNLGWKPESKELDYNETLQDSIVDAKKSRLASRSGSSSHSRIENPELQRSLRQELSESQMFEKRLKAALEGSDPGAYLTRATVPEDIGDVSEILPCPPRVEYAYEPVICSLSPSLGRLLSLIHI